MTTWNQHQYEKQKAEVQTFAILSNPRPGERGQPWPVAEATGRTADEALNHHARRLGFASADDARTRQHPGTGFHLLTAEPSAPGEAARATLRKAAGSGDTVEVRRLLGAGVDVNAADEAGRTALMRAAENGRTETVRLLLLAGADKAAVDLDGFTAQMHAEMEKHDEVTAVLSEPEPSPRPSAADLRAWVAESGTDAHLTAFDALTASDPAADWKAEADRLRHALAVEKAEHASTRAQRDAARQLLTQAQPLIQAAAGRLGVQEPAQDTARRAKVAL